MTIDVQPRLLEWARLRARLTMEFLTEKRLVKEKKISEWEKTGRLNLTQAEKLTKVTHTPLGYLFLPEPPNEKRPIPDQKDAETAMLYALEERPEESVERLFKSREALFSLVVTGRIDVNYQKT